MERPGVCTICHESFKEPKVLPCLHCFCLDCIRMLWVQGRAEVFRCPECHQDVTVPENDPAKLEDAVPQSHQVQLERFVHSLSVGECGLASCSSGQDHAAEVFCTSCAEPLCAGCVLKHRTETEYSDHELIPLGELVDNSKQTQVLQEMRARSASVNDHLYLSCKQHHPGKFHHYCHDCSKLICPTCAATVHAQHQLKSIDKSTEECKKTLQEQLPNVRVLHKRIAGAAAEIPRTVRNIENQGQSLTASVDIAFNRLSKILERRRNDLKKRLEQMVESKVERLHKQKNELMGGADELGRLVHFAEDALKTCTEEEMLGLNQFLQQRISESMQKYSRMGIDPVEVPNLLLRTSCEPHLKDNLQRHVNIYTEQADPTKCSAVGPGLNSAEVKKIVQFSVHTFDRSGKPCRSPQYVTATLKCLSNDLTSTTQVTDESQGYHEVTYCPEFRGLHEIAIEVNRTPIPGSPYPVFVQYPPNLLGKCHGMIDCVTSPRGITINPAGNLLVTEWNRGRVIEITKDGREVRSFGQGLNRRKVLYHPAGIATDTIGNIYVIDAVGMQCCVAKYSGEGHFLKAVGKEGSDLGEFKNPRGIAVNSQNEVFVCDRDNFRIQVFNSSLELIRCLDISAASKDQQLALPSKPNDITFDQAENMYVADFNNNCILCFSSTGQYLFTFSRESHRLAGPESIHMDRNGFIFVTEFKNHRVSVFRINGDFVTKFGVVGSAENELKFPMGIVTDANGFVYVCELFSNRIQVF